MAIKYTVSFVNTNILDYLEWPILCEDDFVEVCVFPEDQTDLIAEITSWLGAEGKTRQGGWDICEIQGVPRTMIQGTPIVWYGPAYIKAQIGVCHWE